MPGQPADRGNSLSQALPAHTQQQVCVQLDSVQPAAVCAGAAICSCELSKERMGVWGGVVQLHCPALPARQLRQHAHSWSYCY